MKYQFLIENKTYHEGILAEHGLSIYIETEERKILFDAGASDAFSLNADRMGIDLSQVDLAVVSHGHSDHTEGFPLFSRINSAAPIYMHKNAFRLSHGFSDGKIEEEMSGIRWNDEVKRAMEDRIHFTDGPCWITDNIVISGTIPYAEGFVPSEKFYYYNLDGHPVEDDMSHEQCLVIREEEGLCVFSGCSHRGVISALNAAKELFPGEQVAVLVAGMHLYVADNQTRAALIEELAGADIGRVLPVHCTGMEATCEIKARLRDRCVIAGAGDTFHGSQG
ncbi:MAG: MBL fold metallo-hydrolase [Firmicutes bacterium]|nr:MBL fold metallo-hydrolase [Bacillota bacterium]